MTTRRLVTRFAVATTLAAVFVGARFGMHVMAGAPAGFAVLPDLKHGEGDAITIAIAETGFPNVTYTATGLPPGITMITGVDSLGHVTGVLTGTLQKGAGGTDPVTNGNAYTGAEGIYNVTVRASDGSQSNTFNWDIGRWASGDVFVGGGTWRYQVYSKEGDFKYDVVVPDNPSLTFGSTTGCAANWRTGEVWATNFDEIYPAVNVITRHAAGPGSPYTDITRRLSTARYSAFSPTPVDMNPESIIFDNAQNMYVGHSNGLFSADSLPLDSAGRPVANFDPPPNIEGFAVVDANGVALLDQNGNAFGYDQPHSPDGFYTAWDTGAPEFLLDALGLKIPLREQFGRDLHKYALGVGGYTTSNRTIFNPRYGTSGIDAMDLMSDQRTLVYSSESPYLMRYDTQGAGTQLPVVGSPTLASSWAPDGDQPHFGVRVLPPGDGSGGYLFQTFASTQRLDANGRVVKVYDVKNDPDYVDGDADLWFSLAIAPDGRSLWAATYSDVFHFDLATGEQIGSKIRATDLIRYANAELAGLCVMNEYRAAMEVCGPAGSGNGIDDDQDGTVDEGCFYLEICSALSPGDDDHDSLVDLNDPDCGAAETCAAVGPTDNSTPGFCARESTEGEPVTVAGLPAPCGNDCAGWAFNYTATGLPGGLTINSTTGEITGTPSYAIVNPNSASTPPVVFHPSVSGSWTAPDSTVTSFAQAFDWTINNDNREPVAANDSGSAVAGQSTTVNVLANDNDPDGDVLSIQSFSQPANGSVTQVGQQLQYTAPLGFSGNATFTYAVKDTYSPIGVSNLATVTIAVNGAPIARDDSYEMAGGTSLTVLAANGLIRNAAGSDSDPEGATVSVVASSVTAPAHGSVSVNADGSFTYTPTPDFAGTDAFTYSVTDGTLVSAPATVSILVPAPPVAVADSYSTMLNTLLSVPTFGGLLTNDTDPRGLTLSVVPSSIVGPAHGTLTVQAGGGFTYLPTTGFLGTDSFTYRVTNGQYISTPATVTISIVDTNHPPVAGNDSYAVNAGSVLTVAAGAILANDSDPDRDLITAALVSSPASGTLVFTLGTGAFVFTPAPNMFGDVTFTYRVSDPFGLTSAPATVTIHVNALPVARNDAYTVAEDTTLTVVAASGLLANDSDSNNDPITVSLGSLTSPAHGTVAVLADGRLTYTPAANYFGADAFTYRVSDGSSLSTPATVNITVTPVNDAPVAVADTYSTAQESPLTISVASNGVIQRNDSDVDDATSTLTASLVSTVSNGTLVLNADGTFVYTPAVGFYGSDAFIYRVSDPSGLTSVPATVTITVLAVDLEVQSSVVCSANAAYVNYSLTSVNYTAAPGTTQIEWIDSLGRTVATQTSMTRTGQVLWPGTVLTSGTATDWPGWVLSGGLWSVGADGFEATKPTVTLRFTWGRTKSVTVNYPAATGSCDPNPGANKAPRAFNDSYTVAEDAVLTVPAPGLLANDTDPEAGPLVVQLPLAISPIRGTVVQDANGSLVYTPAPNYYGPDSFSYRTRDAAGLLSNPANVSITVTPVNDLPVAVSDNFTVAQNATLTASVAGVLNQPGYDTPSGDQGNVWSIVTPAANGTATMNTDGSFTYLSAPTFSGTDSFVYRLCDTDGDCSSATETIVVSAVNNRPVANADAFSATEDTVLNASIATNDVPSLDGGNVWTLVTGTTHGTVTVSPTGNITYTPAANYFGADQFTYRLCDLNNDCSTATVTLSVASVDDAPVAAADQFAGSEDTVLTGSVSANDTPSGDGGNVWALVTGTTHGTVAVTAAGVFTYTPAANYNGTDAFTYRVCDADGDCVTAVASITLAPVNDLPLAANDSVTANGGSTLSATVAGNDTPSGDGGNVWTVTTVPLHGVVTMAANGSYTYAPAVGYAGADSFAYRLCDANGDCAAATVTITVLMSNHPPVAVNDIFVATKSTRLTVTAPGVKSNDSDVDGDTFTAELVTSTTRGTLTLSADGSFIYTPTTGYVGVDSFTYKVKDSKGAYSNVATVTINVTAVVCNLAANNDAYSTNKNHGLVILPRGVLTNDQDPYGRGLAVVEVNGRAASVGVTVATAHGTIKLNADGGFTYTPASNYSGTDTLTYKAKSLYNNSLTNVATVTISVSSHYDNDGCDHDRRKGNHRDGDGCQHDRALVRHYAGDGCDHDRSRNGHHSGDGCAHDRDTHRHFAGDGCDHERSRSGHRAGDGCSHDKNVKSHYDGDGCDHDRRRNGHKDGDNCTHDSNTHHHNDGDGCDHDLKRNGHTDGDKCDHDRDDHGHNAGDGCDHDRGRNGHYKGDNCEHDDHGDQDDDDDNACVAGTNGEHHAEGGHDDQHHSGDYCDHDRNRKGHYKGDGCEHDRVSGHSAGDNCDHERRRNGHYAGDRCDHDRAQKGDRDYSWSWNDRG